MGKVFVPLPPILTRSLPDQLMVGTLFPCEPTPNSDGSLGLSGLRAWRAGLLGMLDPKARSSGRGLPQQPEQRFVAHLPKWESRP